MAPEWPDIFCGRPRTSVIVREAGQLEGAGAGSIYIYTDHAATPRKLLPHLATESVASLRWANSIYEHSILCFAATYLKVCQIPI
jgi:hypothetical protein